MVIQGKPADIAVILEGSQPGSPIIDQQDMVRQEEEGPDVIRSEVDYRPFQTGKAPVIHKGIQSLLQKCAADEIDH